MKKKTLVLIPVLLTLVVATAVLLPRALHLIRTCKALEGFLEQKEPAMDFSAQITLGEMTCTLEAELDCVTSGGKTVTVLSRNGGSIYYCDGLMYLENGRAYRLTEPSGEEISAWKGALWLLHNAQVKMEEDGCTVTIRGAQARDMLEWFCPGAKDLVPELDSLTVALGIEENALSQIRFRGSAWLGQTKLSLDITGDILPSGRKKTIPAAVDNAIRAGDPSQAEPLTEAGIRFFGAVLALEQQETLTGTLTLSADCGPLTLDKTLGLVCWQLEGKRIYSIQENGMALYYCDGTFCDGQGRSLSLQGENASAVKLPEMLLAICLGLRADCREIQGEYVYRFSLDGDTMEKLAYAIAPEAEKLPISLTEGSLEILLAQDRIQSLNVRIGGSLSLVLTQVDVAIGGEVTLLENTAPDLPEAVKAALLP